MQAPIFIFTNTLLALSRSLWIPSATPKSCYRA